MAPMYVIFEGIDGSGKSLQVKMLVDHLKRSGRRVIRVQEPDKRRPMGRLLRDLMAKGSYPESHAALFLADRLALHLREIVPALYVGAHVVSDRSFLSTLAYQQEQWGLEWLFGIHQALPAKADAIIITDVDPAKGLSRVAGRQGGTEYYETLDFLGRIRGRYLALAQDPRIRDFLTPKGRIEVIDTTNLDPATTHARVLSTIEGL